MAALLVLVTVPAANAQTPTDSLRIVDRPIQFGGERTRLTVEYRRIHEDPAASSVHIEPRMIILHFTGNGSLESSWQYFNRTRIEAERKDVAKAGAVNVSAHFLVDRDGMVYRLLPETTMARHCIGLNHIAIGVENVGDADRFPLTDAQVEADAALVRYLATRFPITHLIGHLEYRAMEGHPYFRERDPAYRNRKVDPGAEFMRRVRARLSDLHLKGPPS
jgi:N-acetylmuramoyl-L-alanine amidase